MANIPQLTSIAPDTGTTEGNVPVALIGRNLEHVVSVKFGSEPATDLEISSASSLTCNTPPYSPGYVNVIAVDDQGLSSDPIGFTYE
jgi:hypothetical protein